MTILQRIKERVSLVSRNSKADLFYSLCKEGMSILDAGVSSERKALLPSSNHFLKTFKYDPYLFSYSTLKKMLNRSLASTFNIYKNRFCGLVMTFTVICSE